MYLTAADSLIPIAGKTASLLLKFWKQSLATILLGLSHISETHYYGTTLLIDVLRGSESKRISDTGLNLLPEYGKLKTISHETLFSIIEWMIENHYILKTKHPKYPVLHPTYEGTHYDETITINKLKKLLTILQNNSGTV